MAVTYNVNVAVLANRRSGKTCNVKMVYDEGRFIEKEWKRGQKEEEEDEGWPY